MKRSVCVYMATQWENAQPLKQDRTINHDKISAWTLLLLLGGMVASPWMTSTLH